MNKLSVVIITFNEARNIKRAIQSVKNIADEIIIVDSFSTDDTPAICQSLNVQFHQQKWLGYSEQKNYANSLAKFPTIFSLDADEAVDKNLEKEIINLKEEGFKAIYAVNRMTNYCGQWIKHSGWYPDKKIRIFPRETKWEGIVHETLQFEKEFQEIELAGNLEHYSYYSFEQHKQVADKYSYLTAIKMNNKGKKASVIKPYLSAFGRFVSMYLIKLGFLDGKMGFKIAQISAKSNILKYQELRRLNRESN
jgi:(heptosyl)LPS beta-1,4-glucosyltransferase